MRNGLVAVDIDGPLAERLKKLLGDQWPDAAKPEPCLGADDPGVVNSSTSSLTAFALFLPSSKEQFIPELKDTDEEVCIRYNNATRLFLVQAPRHEEAI